MGGFFLDEILAVTFSFVKASSCLVALVMHDFESMLMILICKVSLPMRGPPNRRLDDRKWHAFMKLMIDMSDDESVSQRNR